MAINVITWGTANFKWDDNNHLWNVVEEVIAETLMVAGIKELETVPVLKLAASKPVRFVPDP